LQTSTSLFPDVSSNAFVVLFLMAFIVPWPSSEAASVSLSPPTVSESAETNGYDSERLVSTSAGTATQTLFYDLDNAGFESGDFTFWTTLGNTSVVTALLGNEPTEGDFQAFLTTATLEEETGEPESELETVSAADLELFLDLPHAGIDLLSTNPVSNGAVIQQTFIAAAEAVLKLDLTIVTYALPGRNNAEMFSDANSNNFAFVTLAPEGASTEAFQTFTLPASTQPEATAFTTVAFTLPAAGTYTLSIGIVDVEADGKPAALLVDNILLVPVDFSQTSN
jgi:hypothetical protein